MNYKRLATVAILLIFIVGIGAAAEKSDQTIDKIEHQNRIAELKNVKDVQHTKLKTFDEKQKFNNKVSDIKDFNDKADVYSSAGTTDLEVWKGKDNSLKFRDTGTHKVRDLKIKYSDLEDVPGFNKGHVRITHYTDSCIPDVSWVQHVPNDGGYGYIDGVPFSEVVIGGFTGVWVVDDPEYLETTENINIGYSADPGMVDFINAYVNDFNVTGSVVGFEWDQSDPSPITRTIDINGDTLTNYDYDKHPIWGNIKRCTINTSTSDVTYGTNARGDGLDLLGGDGPVMVEIPRFWVKSDNSTGTYIWWISPYNLSDYGFEVHPAFMQRNGYESDKIYVGAYPSVLGVNSTGGLIQNSYTAEQPWTGGEIDSVAFTSGSTEFYIGDNVTGETSNAYGYVVNYYVSSGTWGGNDAAGTVYLKQVNGIYQAENLQVSAATVAVSTGANSPISLTIDEAETYANNIGAGWGTTNFWTLSAAKLLMFTEWASLDSQTALGKGVVDLPSGDGFAGVENGADSADSNIAENGTGMGTGANGYTPVDWRGLENPYWSNVNTGIIGYTAVDSGYRLARRDGLGSLAAVLTEGNYEESLAIPINSDGYISDIEYEDLLQYAFLGKATAGNSNAYIPDYQYSHDVGETNVLFAGGAWYDGVGAGVGRLHSSSGASLNDRSFGARLEYIPVISENVTSPQITNPNIKFKTNSNSTYSAGWNDSGDNPVSIPYGPGDSDITTVHTISDVLGILDLNVTLGYLENTTVINEELTDEYYRVYITHIPGNSYISGNIEYTSDPNSILDSPFLHTNLTSNNENASYTLSTYNWSVSTGAMTAGTTYNYVLTAYLEGTIIDDTDRDGIGYTGLGAYEAEGNETVIIGSRYTCYSPISGEWAGAARGSDVYVPVSGIILVSILIIGVGLAIRAFRGFKED